MIEVFTPGVDVDDFLRSAQENAYSMQTPFIDPELCAAVSDELREEGFLKDKVELQGTRQFNLVHMKAAILLHRAFNNAISDIEGTAENHLPYFSVRVFEPGVHGTTIHRNHPTIGPWAIGITLRGEAPFSVYGQDVLSGGRWDQTIELSGNDDPEPEDSMNATAGSAWTLYTSDELKPHSGGLVSSETQRELLILYNYGERY